MTWHTKTREMWRKGKGVFAKKEKKGVTARSTRVNYIVALLKKNREPKPWGVTYFWGNTR